jgi:hypothetical protein
MSDFPADRKAFREALTAHLARTFPGAVVERLEEGRRILVTFPGIGTCSIWEPNFYFARSSGFGPIPPTTDAYIFARAVEYIAGQRAALATHLHHRGTEDAEENI